MRGGATKRIGTMHLADQRADVGGDRRAAETDGAGTPVPMLGEETAMPADDGSGFHDEHGSPPAAPHS